MTLLSPIGKVCIDRIVPMSVNWRKRTPQSSTFQVPLIGNPAEVANTPIAISARRLWTPRRTLNMDGRLLYLKSMALPSLEPALLQQIIVRATSHANKS